MGDVTPVVPTHTKERRRLTGGDDKRGVFVPLWAMKACDGNPRDAMVLAQITWWLQPAWSDGGLRTRQITQRSGYAWLYLTDGELGAETGMSVQQVRRGRMALKAAGLIDYRAAQIDGQKVTLVRPLEAEPTNPQPNVDIDESNSRPSVDIDESETSISTNAPSIRNRGRSISIVGSDLPDRSSEAKKVNGKPGDTSSEDELERTFAIMWEAYPPRDGKRIGEKQALQQWRKLSLGDRRAAHKGAKNLAEAVTAGGRFGVPDLHRWLRDRRWEEWQEPARVEGNGQRPRDPVAARQAGWVPRQSETHTWKVESL